MDRGKRSLKRSMAVDASGIPLGSGSAPANRYDSALGPHPKGDSEALGGLPELASVHLDRGYDSRLSRERLEELGLRMGDLAEGQACAIFGHESVGCGAHEFVAQHPQEAYVLHGEGGEGDLPLGGLLRRGDHREATIPTTMSPFVVSSKPSP